MHNLIWPAAVCRIAVFAILLLFQSDDVRGESPASAVKLVGELLEGIPAGLIMVNQHLPYLFWVELRAAKLHLLERTATGNYRNRETFPVTLGKRGFGKDVEGDRKTPVGIYQITSFLGDDVLDESYGIGAYPLNYPNIWDRLSQRTGHGIWLHGLPKGTDQRPTFDSDGCVIIDNSTLEQFASYINVGESLFVLSETLDWLPPGSSQPSADILDAMEHWRESWEANDNTAYLANYHQEFNDSKRNLAQWKAYKTRVNSRKSYIRVEFSKTSVLAYPNEDNLLAMRMYQRYKSSNYTWQGWKHLLWRRDESGVWRILYEGNG